ncbi:MAG: response regulator [bacterium]|nr:MAG: response regulator [bacterium]
MPWKPRIIIISPRASELTTLSAQLMGVDYDIIQAMTFKDAKSELYRTIPHLLIIDPAIDGFTPSTLNQLLRRFGGHAQVPLLYILDRRDDFKIIEIIREGIDDTIFRPIFALELITRSRSLLRNRQLLGQIRLQELFLRRRNLKPYSPLGKKPGILLFEDEGEHRNRIETIVKNLGCSLSKTGSAREALEMVTASAPDLVIMDILFPEKDGFDLCRFLKSNSATRNIPLLMLTSVPELDNRILGFDFGPDDYLVKPAPEVEILTRIRRLLTRRSGHERLAGNYQILIGEDLADPFSGYAGEEYFRFYLPEMTQWSQSASLPFSLSTFKFRTVSALQLASNVLVRSLRNLDAIFKTGDLELSLVLPETPASKARNALSRLVHLLEAEGLERGAYLAGSASTPEDGWDPERLTFLSKQRATVLDQAAPYPETPPRESRIVVLSSNGSGGNLALNLEDRGLHGAEPVTLMDLETADIPSADLVIVQGDCQRGYSIMTKVRELPGGRQLPILFRPMEGLSEDEEKAISGTADDYVPGEAGLDYLAHRVKKLLTKKEEYSNRNYLEGVLGHLVRMAESSDPTMKGHTRRVSQTSVAFGMRMNLMTAELEALRWGSILHDIGKIFIPDRILHKPGMLDPEEYAVVKSHPKIGYNLCCGIPFLEPSLPIIKHHHERMDGGGYPEGLNGEQIPLLTRIVSVVDVYDSLQMDRTYRRAFNCQEAQDILLSESEKGLWDSYIVEEFIEMISEAEDVR